MDRGGSGVMDEGCLGFAAGMLGASLTFQKKLVGRQSAVEEMLGHLDDQTRGEEAMGSWDSGVCSL